MASPRDADGDGASREARGDGPRQPAAVAAKRGEGSEEAARKPACTDDLEGPVERGPDAAIRSGGVDQPELFRMVRRVRLCINANRFVTLKLST